MNHIKNPICDQCNEEVSSYKSLRRIKDDNDNKIYLCGDCYRMKRLERRKKILEEDKPKIKLKRISHKEEKSTEPPVPKGSKSKNEIKKSYSFLTFQESQMMFKSLIKKGYTYQESKRIMNEFQRRLLDTRKKMKKMNKSEEDIKIKQNKMLEELWNY